ncbi:hypothetical protein E4O05_11775 [Treponema sp. OMZ 787]|uniref:hypothetical protein n=1 Tax=Treponema sp. OMZ 787 TaxID=2563669 RepID=UPI0020A40D08|nr:hypothetical protein [Treponema sp. OMZ 787]UTC62175.1 hypothetical protein E4O05_11775 [Treponema sp. OMZ 787]
MKNKKIFAALIILAAFALVFSSCTFKMDTNQKAHYETFITGLENAAKLGDIDKETVKSTLNMANTGAAALNYTIIDKTPSENIKKDTTADALKKRFVPKKK